MTKADLLKELQDAIDALQGGNWTDNQSVKLLTAARQSSAYELFGRAPEGMMSRTRWEALPPAEQAAYLRGGGKLFNEPTK